MEKYSDRFQDGELPRACLTNVRSLSYPTPELPNPFKTAGAAVAVQGKLVEGSFCK